MKRKSTNGSRQLDSLSTTNKSLVRTRATRLDQTRVVLMVCTCRERNIGRNPLITRPRRPQRSRRAFCWSTTNHSQRGILPQSGAWHHDRTRALCTSLYEPILFLIKSSFVAHLICVAEAVEASGQEGLSLDRLHDLIQELSELVCTFYAVLDI